MKKSRTDAVNDTELGTEPLREILFKIQPRSIFQRVRRASREFEKLVSDTNFALCYQQRQNARRVLILEDKDNYLLFKTFTVTSATAIEVKLVSRVPTFGEEDIRISSDKGLCCLPFKDYLILLNPTTSQWRRISLPPTSKPLNNLCFKDNCSKRNIFLGFGRTAGEVSILSVTSTSLLVQYHLYKVVRGEEGVWREIKYNTNHTPDRSSMSVCIEGTVYYCGRRLDSKRSIMTYDTHSEILREVALPGNYFDAYNFTDPVLANLNGKLAIGNCRGLQKSRSLWSLTSASSSTWSETVICPMPFKEGLAGKFYDLFFHGSSSNGEELVFCLMEYGDNGLQEAWMVYYQTKTGGFKRVELDLDNNADLKDHIWDENNVWNHTESVYML